MHRLRLCKPSPAMAVALVALFVALAGTAAAAGFGPFKGDRIIRKRSLSGNRLKNGTITRTQINVGALGTVPNASHANSADVADTANTAGAANTANTANSANTANTATTAGPLAYADVAEDGTFTGNAAHKNIDSVSHTAGTGIYCINPAAGVSFSGAVLNATPDFSSDSTHAGTGHAVVETRSSGFDCSSAQLEVITFDVSNTGAVTVHDEGFEVTIQR